MERPAWKFIQHTDEEKIRDRLRSLGKALFLAKSEAECLRDRANTLGDDITRAQANGAVMRILATFGELELSQYIKTREEMDSWSLWHTAVSKDKTRDSNKDFIANFPTVPVSTFEMPCLWHHRVSQNGVVDLSENVGVLWSNDTESGFECAACGAKGTIHHQEAWDKFIVPF